MRVCVVYPSTGLDKEGFSIGIPLSALHVATAVKKAGYDVVLVDRRLGQEVPLGCWVYCFSCMTGFQISDALVCAKKIRDVDEHAFLVWGGVHSSLLPEQTLENFFVDCVMVGEGDKIIVDWLNDLRDGKSVGRVIKQEGFLNLDSLPEPDYSLINIDNYFMNLYQSKKTLSLLTGKGCPHRCQFCYNKNFNKQQWRGLCAEKIVERVRVLNGFGAESVDLVDDNFFVDKKRVVRFCELVYEEKLCMSFLTNCRADYIARFDDDFLCMLKGVGFNELFVGIESGSQRVLDFIKKDLTLEQIKECNRKLKKAGIRPIYSFICGFPTETRGEVFETLDLMLWLLKEYPGAAVTSLKVFTPFPGCELFDVCVKGGFVPPKRLEDWGGFDYNTVQFKKDVLLEKLSLITYFLDYKTLEGVSNNFFIKAGMFLYGLVVRFRCRHKLFVFMPETRLIKWLKKN